MKLCTFLLVLVAVAAAFGVGMPNIDSARAADLAAGSPVVRAAATAATLRAEGSPFRRSKRAQSILGSDACWRDCQSYCIWGEAVCLALDAQGRCLQSTDRCDRLCQSTCRTRGGPLVGFVE